MPAATNVQQVHRLVAPVVTGAGLWLEDVVLVRDGGRQVLRVVVDTPEDVEDSVDLDAVAELSREVSAVLDQPSAAATLPDRYTLEVSTRGATAAMTARRHFVRAVGRLVVLRLTDGGTLSGRLVDVERSERDGDDGGTVVVTPVTPGVKGRPPKIGDPVRVPLTEVRDGVVEVELVQSGKDDDGASGAGDRED